MNAKFVVVSKGTVLGSDLEYVAATALAKKVAVDTGVSATIRTMAAHNQAAFNATPEGKALMADKAAQRQAAIMAEAEANELFRKTRADWTKKLQTGKFKQDQIGKAIAKAVAAYDKSHPNIKFVPKPIWMAKQNRPMTAVEIATVIALGAIS